MGLNSNKAEVDGIELTEQEKVLIREYRAGELYHACHEFGETYYSNGEPVWSNKGRRYNTRCELDYD